MIDSTSADILEYDLIKMYFGEDYTPVQGLTIKQPTIGEIIEFGENKFYSIVSTLCANTTSLRVELWNNGVDWNEISDFQLFSQLIKGFNSKDTQLLFGDINLSWFEVTMDEETHELILLYIPRDENGEQLVSNITEDNAIIINEIIYLKIVNYLRDMFDIHPKTEYAKGRLTKEAIIDEEKINERVEKEKLHKDQKKKSVLLPLISSMLNHPGFKYKKNELKQVGIVEFMDSVKRLQTYENVIAFMGGMYSGMVDTSKIKDINTQLNWMRNL